MKKTIICTSCPVGCEIEVTAEGDKITDITGNTCPRGAKYAEAEYFHPERVLTASVKTTDGRWVSVRSESPIPREKLIDASEYLSHIEIPLPVEMGQCVCEDILNTGVRVIATREIKE